MTPEEIKTKSAELAALYVAKANGKILEYATPSVGWIDSGSASGPDMQSDLTRWRVKPEPRRMWETPSATFGGSGYVRTQHADEAERWKARGNKVTEWQEVLP